MERSLSTLTQLPTTSTQIKSYQKSIKDDILSGYIPAEESAIIIKSLEEIVKGLKADVEIKEYIQDSADKYNEKTFEYKGAKLTKSERTTYDFSSDEEYSELKEQEQDIKSYIKAREEILKRNRDNFPSKTTSFISIKLEK